MPPQIVVATEQYNRLARLLLRKQRVTLELNVQNRFIDDTLDSFNIMAEIPGHRPRRAKSSCSAHTSIRGTPAPARPTTRPGRR